MNRTLMLTTVLAVLNTHTWADNEPTKHDIKPAGDGAAHAVDRVAPGYAAAGHIDMRLEKMSASTSPPCSPASQLSAH